MALLMIEGFDDGLANSRVTTPVPAPSTAYGFNGTKGARLGDLYGSYGWQWNSHTSDTTITMGARVKIFDDGSPDSGQYYVLGFSAAANDLGNFECVLGRTIGDDGFSLRDRSGYTFWGPGTFKLNTWYYIEIQFTKGDSPTGAWEVWVDGVSVQSATGRDTLVSTLGFAQFGGQGTNDVDGAYFDDLYVLDSTGSFNNDVLGISHVPVPSLPSGNGNSSVLVGSDADSTDNYLLVDNNAAEPPATTEYVESSTEGDKDTYAMDDLADTPVVHGVMTSLYSTKDDTGAKFVRPVIRSGTTDYPGTSFSLLNTTYSVIDECWDVDPDTATTWLYGGVNSAQVGVEVRDS